MKNTSFIAFVICVLVIPGTLFAQDAYRPFMAYRFDMYFDANLFSTTSNFDANGSKQDLITNASLQAINTELSARYLFLHSLGVYSGLRFNNIDTNNGLLSRTNSILTYYFFGADYELYRSGGLSLYADVSYAISNEEIDVAGDTAIASDGANEAKASGAVVYENGDFRTFARAGVNYRADGLSLLAIYGFGADYMISPIRIGMDFSGISTVQDDDNTATPVNRDLVTTRVNGGSRKYFAVNPNLLEGKLYVSYNLDKDLSIKMYGGAGLVGSNSAQGMTYGGSINWGFGAGRKTSQPIEIQDSNSISDQDPNFKVDTDDGVNQDLFRKTSPVKPPKK